ncbi:hypothetical protein [Nocardia amamiensis]|uniref:hypothetical protein n=1 Tax=Nocardia amamiensis TaxID=404578 RepID=UPI0012F4E0FB|nr:hypothetical protein [Nocardia amamiensis]
MPEQHGRQLATMTNSRLAERTTPDSRVQPKAVCPPAKWVRVAASGHPVEEVAGR